VNYLRLTPEIGFVAIPWLAAAPTFHALTPDAERIEMDADW
jgi:hypothetical protein